jgi:excisionase family DNA binding protein
MGIALGVTERTVRHWIQIGVLPAIKVGAHWGARESWLRAFVEGLENEALAQAAERRAALAAAKEARKAQAASKPARHLARPAPRRFTAGTGKEVQTAPHAAPRTPRRKPAQA